MAEEADVLISWYATNKETQAVRPAFKRPTRFIEMPAGPGTSYPAQLQKYGPSALRSLCKTFLPNVKPLRIGLMGFSEGCQGVREALKSGDAPLVDAVLAIDGIHEQWIDKKQRTFETGLLLPWKAYGTRAVVDGRLLFITTSAVKPDFVDTTTTSTWLWQQCSGRTEPTYDEPIDPRFYSPDATPYTNPAGSFGPGQQSWKSTTYDRFPLHEYRKSDGLVILNYDNLDATGVGDHIFQAVRVAPLAMQLYLAARWNAIDPTTPCSGAT